VSFSLLLKFFIVTKNIFLNAPLTLPLVTGDTNKTQNLHNAPFKEEE